MPDIVLDFFVRTTLTMLDANNELWRPIPDYPGYSVSSHGRVRSEVRFIERRNQNGYWLPQKLLCPGYDGKGYLRFSTSHRGKIRTMYVHRAVALAFIGPQAAGFEARHLDGNSTNNQLDNISYGTRSMSIAAAKRHGTFPLLEKRPGAKLTREMAVEIASSTDRTTVVAARYGIGVGVVRQIRLGLTWESVTRKARAKNPWNAKAHQFSASQIDDICSTTEPLRATARRFGVDRQVIKRVRKQTNTDAPWSRSIMSYDNGVLVTRQIKATQLCREATTVVRCRSGRDLRIGYDQKILTQRGWLDADRLTTDHYLIRFCAEMDGGQEVPDAELDFVTLMMFEGGCSGRTIRFTSADPQIVEAFHRCAHDLGIGIKQYGCNQPIDYDIMGGAGSQALPILKKYGLLGCLSINKRLPHQFYNIPLHQKYRFLSLMFATDGYVIKTHGMLGVALASEGLIDDISLFLDTCGVPTRKYAKPNDCAGAWELAIGASHVKRLAGKLNMLQKQIKFLRALDYKCRESTIFGYPYDLTKGLTGKCRQVSPKINFKHAGVMVSDAKLDRMIVEISPALARWKMRDFIYDRVATITASGEHEVTRLEIDAPVWHQRNYIENGYVVAAKNVPPAT